MLNAGQTKCVESYSSLVQFTIYDTIHNKHCVFSVVFFKGLPGARGEKGDKGEAGERVSLIFRIGLVICFSLVKK